MHPNRHSLPAAAASLYVIGAHDGCLLVTDERFSKVWKTPTPPRAPSPSAADTIGIALDATAPLFQHASDSALERQDLVLVGVPTAGGSLREDSSVRTFPAQLREASQRYPVYRSLDGDGSSGLFDIDEQRSLFRGMAWRDLGDLSAESTRQAESLTGAATRLSAWALERDVRTIALGGDHAVTYSLIQALLSASGRRLIVVDFDAHNDCGVNAHPETRLHHANFMRHVLEFDEVIGVVQVGVRGVRSLGQVFSHPKLIQLPPAPRNRRDLQAILARLQAGAPDAIGYVSIDLDVLDPRDFPLVEFPAAGGLRAKQVMALLRSVFQSSLPVLGVDIVEGCAGGVVEAYDVPLRMLAHCMDGIFEQRLRSRGRQE